MPSAYAAPRVPAARALRHTGRPVAASSAMTAFGVVRYMTPSATTGVARPLPPWYSQRTASDPTFEALIWSSGAWRELAMSKL